MIVHERLKRLRELLARSPQCPISRIQQELGVSRSTVRRDLLALEEEGLVVRVHGGAVHRDLLQGEETFDRRSREHRAAKRRIATAAAASIENGQAVFVDAGTTCLEAGRLLLLREDVRLFTHSTRLVAEAEASGKSVICLGGALRAATGALVGGLTLAWLESLHFDVALVGASGLSVDAGASTTELSEAAVKREAIKRAEHAFLLADAEKFDRPAAVAFAGWRHFERWVTDRAAPPEARQAVRQQGVKIVACGGAE